MRSLSLVPLVLVLVVRSIARAGDTDVTAVVKLGVEPVATHDGGESGRDRSRTLRPQLARGSGVSCPRRARAGRL
ncbi:MAG: hypothetical protein B6D46_04355 [Polyangiaceae bacterium UTPRO1]|nr:MAG: hypothetical protein B6D46_04355 [Polyangiaceae bacterium UTPRO1]